MPHYLMNRSKEDGNPHAFANPFIVSMRYQCDCTGGEVLTINTVFDLENFRSHEGEEIFIWTMKRMFRDMKTEIAQHMNTGKKE